MSCQHLKGAERRTPLKGRSRPRVASVMVTTSRSRVVIGENAAVMDRVIFRANVTNDGSKIRL